jgi:hypothetical protein
VNIIKMGITGISLVIAGCASNIPRLTAAGAAVRSVSPSVAQSCTHLGLVSSFTPVLYGGIQGAHLDARNQVAALGGNAILMVSSEVSPGRYAHGDVTAEAYRCEFK